MVMRWSAPAAESAATAVAIFVVEAGVWASSAPLPYSRLPVATSTTTAVRSRAEGGVVQERVEDVREGLLGGGGTEPVEVEPPRPVSTVAALGAGRGAFADVPDVRP